jgi:hypothetical protein
MRGTERSFESLATLVSKAPSIRNSRRACCTAVVNAGPVIDEIRLRGISGSGAPFAGEGEEMLPGPKDGMGCELMKTEQTDESFPSLGMESFM